VKINTLFALVVVAFVLLGAARSASAENSSPPALVARLAALSDAWDKAIVRKDRAAIEANMAEDFRVIDGDGDVSAKKAFVDGLTAPDLQIDPYTVEEFDVRVLGDVALLSGRTHMTGHEGGKAFTSNYRYIDIYVKRAGVWKIVNVQITRLRAAQP